MITFRSPNQPAHKIADEPGFKFVGGKLVVPPRHADTVRNYARRYPALGIVEEYRKRAPRKPKGEVKP